MDPSGLTFKALDYDHTEGPFTGSSSPHRSCNAHNMGLARGRRCIFSVMVSPSSCIHLVHLVWSFVHSHPPRLYTLNLTGSMHLLSNIRPVGLWFSAVGSSACGSQRKLPS